MNAPVLRPLGVGEIFDVAIKIFRANAGTLLKLVGLVVVPLGILSGLIEISALPEDEDAYFEDSDAFGTYIAGVAVSGLLGFLATIVATAACFKAVADAYLGTTPTWRNSLAFVFRRLHSVLWITILMTLLLIPAFLACLLPGIWLGVAWSVAIPAQLTEGVKGTKALGRSFRLVRGRWWPALAVVALGYLLTGIVGGALGALVGGVTAYDTTDPTFTATVATIVAQIFADAVTIPFIAAFLVVLYFDLRVRKEAFDLQLLAQQIGVEPPEGIGPPPQEPPPPTGPGSEPPFWPPPPGWKPSPPDQG